MTISLHQMLCQLLFIVLSKPPEKTVLLSGVTATVVNEDVWPSNLHTWDPIDEFIALSESSLLTENIKL